MGKTETVITVKDRYSAQKLLPTAVLEETNASGVAQADYIYLHGRPVAVLNGSTFYILHDDRLGTPQVASDNSQNIQWQAGYEPFGQASASGTITQNPRFPGQHFDVESGWKHNGFRDYIPQLGRYIEPDPLGRAGSGNNLYVYVGDNPVNLVDPLGLCPAMKTPDKPCKTGFGFGVQGGGDGALGIGAAGAIATGGAGAGLFFGGNQGVGAGTYESGGASAYAGSNVSGVPAQSMGAPTSVGAGLGPLGGGVFLTNASQASQLGGPFLTIGAGVGLDVSLGAQLSIGVDASGNTIYQFQLSGGLGWGLYGYSLTTKAAAQGTGGRCGGR